MTEEQTTPRPLEKIQKEYEEICKIIGDRTLQIKRAEAAGFNLMREADILAQEKAKIDAANKAVDEKKSAKKLKSVPKASNVQSQV